MESVLLYIVGVIVIVIGLALSVGLHELGHYLPAKWFGVKVTKFMIGFGPTIWSRQRGETEVGIKAIPLGGYVAMIGMFPPKHEGEAPSEDSTGFFQNVAQDGARIVREQRVRSAGQDTAIQSTDSIADPEITDAERLAAINDPGGRLFSRLIEDARSSSAETIGPGEDHRAFYRLPAWKRIIVMLGGPFMNFVLAFVFYAILIVGFGLPQTTTTVGTVNACLVPAGSGQTTCTDADPASPAAAAGMLPGDRLVSIDGQAIQAWSDVAPAIAAIGQETAEFVVERDGSPLTLRVTPVLTERYQYDDKGATVLGPDGDPVIVRVPMVGISPLYARVGGDVGAVLPAMGENISAVANVIINLPQRLVAIVEALFGPDERDPNGPISVVGVGRIAGEIASADWPVLDRVASMFGILASLNIALGVFNLIPLPPLDGGHVAGATYEAIRRRIAKLFGKRDPGPVDMAKLMPVTLTMVLILGGMSALLIIADIFKPISLFG